MYELKLNIQSLKLNVEGEAQDKVIKTFSFG
jgi:hypothetical protein